MASGVETYRSMQVGDFGILKRCIACMWFVLYDSEARSGVQVMYVSLSHEPNWGREHDRLRRLRGRELPHGPPSIKSKSDFTLLICGFPNEHMDTVNPLDEDVVLPVFKKDKVEGFPLF